MSTTTVNSVCPYCGVGCGIVLHVEANKLVKVAGDKRHPTNFGRLCTKGSTSWQAVAAPGRLSHPQLRAARGAALEQRDMDGAIRETARRLRAIIDAHGPDAFSFYISGQ